MAFYHSMGQIPRKRHTVHRRSDGQLILEEMIGLDGFVGNKSLLYHTYSPTEIVRVGDNRSLDWELDEPRLLSRLFHTFNFKPLQRENDAVTGRRPILVNDDVAISICHPSQSMDYFYRTANGDEVYFVHEGNGKVESVLGELGFHEGDYVVIPQGVTYRLLLGNGPVKLFVIEASGRVDTPERYRNTHGQFLEHSPYCERDVRPPEKLVTHDERGEFELRVKRGNVVSTFYMGHHPLDVLGWDGFVYPYAINIRDFEPITGRLHQPPPVHQMFEGQGFVVCSFVPRLFDYHPLAMPVPYYHNNINCDEVLYYVDGDFMSRKGVNRGSITLHPGGLVHGPQPGKMEAGIGKKETDEVAVMIDTFRPLRVAKIAEEVEDKSYMLSWMENK